MRLCRVPGGAALITPTKGPVADVDGAARASIPAILVRSGSDPRRRPDGAPGAHADRRARDLHEVASTIVRTVEPRSASSGSG